ncbi:MarR family winged helix-turn-helix transcriptional regulator [Hyphomicrobium facile]|uniref:DNA-binding transcriptional regulator, MarR family n=1 Tax=Hyphomicrobium facile TaxID=51670 RepID=A0A1I7MYW8_9HYPH|nr:MarR family transcriptional regulator [Hyphomicrobium facile]SFV27535.1 DNA-binding transcriptional regulator, MarR family [Hyphomicrobium facile]
MADITSEGPSEHLGATGHSPVAAADDRPSSLVDLIGYIELFYFAYRDFTCDPDAILAQYGFGRAHHRVLHFVHRIPGLKVAELLDILKITKQSLARVLKQLVDEGFIIQKAGNEDRRERRLYLSAKGARLNDKLTQIQAKRIEGALANLGPGADALARNFLFGMITEKNRPQVETLIKGQRADTSEAAPDCNT